MRNPFRWLRLVLLCTPLVSSRPGLCAAPAAQPAPAAALKAASTVDSDFVPDEDNFARPLITGRHGMVTSLNPLSTMAGIRILMQGGNAFDAAVATAAATTVVDPKNSTIGGQGFAMLYVAKEHRVRALNFYGGAPQAATIEAVKGKNYLEGYLATPVPSTLKGYAELHRVYGKLPWRDVLQPAIELAEQGFVVTEDFTAPLELHKRRLEYPSTQRVFFPNGQAPRPGEIFRQPDLARTLRRIAEEGADVFYKGEIAHQIADFYATNGGILSYADLAAYQAQWVEPISTDYHGYTIFTQPPNSSGIALLLQMNILEGYDLSALGHNTPQYLHLIGEVQRVAIAERNRYVADPEYVSIPISKLLSKEYAAKCRSLISLDATMTSVPRPNGPGAPDKEDTTHLTVVDEEGNMVSLTQTMGAWYGSGVVAADTGVLFSNQMRHLHTDPESPSRVGPGRRPRSNQSPLIILKGSEPVMAIGTPGSDGIWQRMAQVLVNIIDFKMDIQRAVTAPRMIYGAYQETGTEIPPVFQVEDRIPFARRTALRQRGFVLKVIPSDDGSVNGVMRDPKTGFLRGGADPRRWGLSTGSWSGPASSVYAIGW